MPYVGLALADIDVCFLEKFSVYLRKNQATYFNLELFTSASIFEDWLRESGKADLIVISSAMFLKLKNPPPADSSVILLRDCSEGLIPSGYVSISKFQSADILMREILSFYAENVNFNISHSNKSTGSVNLVLYSDGSDVLNPFAQTLAYTKAMQGKSTFYINLDELSNTEIYFQGNNPKGLSEFLYYIKSKKENLSIKAEICTSKSFEYGLDYMKSHQNTLDITNLSSLDVKTLIEAIRERSIYEEIVISRAFHNDDILSTLILESHRIYITCINYPSSYDRILKITNILSKLDELKKLELKKKIILCISLVDGSNDTLRFDASGFERAYLPFENGDYAFPPSKNYQSAIEIIAAR